MHIFIPIELRTQTAGAVVKLRESRQEMFTALYRKQEKQWVDFFSSAKKVSKLKEITEVSEECPFFLNFDWCMYTLSVVYKVSISDANDTSRTKTKTMT